MLCRTTPFLDVDILHPDAARAVSDLVAERFDGDAVLMRFGRPPKRAIPFRTEEPFAKITKALVAPDGSEERLEFLADGQQCVASNLLGFRGARSWFAGHDVPVVRRRPNAPETSAQRVLAEGYAHDHVQGRAALPQRRTPARQAVKSERRSADVPAFRRCGRVSSSAPIESCQIWARCWV